MLLRLVQKCFFRPMSPRLPIVVVLGATGVGKSQLAIDIASKYKGEVISADSMQVYKNLDVTTNKVTDDETKGVPHHMIDFLHPADSFTVVDFRNRSLPIIDRLRNEGKMPVIVGGTNYYIESLIWKTLVEPDDHKDSGELVHKSAFHSDPNESAESLHAKLKAVDPKRADQIHPNDRRKVERSLEVYYRKKRSHSEYIEDQRKQGGVLGGPIRFKDVIIFWIRCNQDVLEERLDKRVDKMISQGLIDEMLNFHNEHNSTREEPDYTLGIFQSIGFKEFHQYLIASQEVRDSKAGKKMFDNCLLLMKQRTKRYSKYQTKWILKRFLGEPEREVPPIYSLDGTNIEEWNENVRDVALEILHDVIAQRPTKRQPMENQNVQKAEKAHHVCECGVICMNALTFEAHIKSKKHYRNMQALRKQSESSEDQTADSNKKQKIEKVEVEGKQSSKEIQQRLSSTAI